MTRVPASYSVTYQVEEKGAETRDRVTIRRPFDSRLEHEVGGRWVPARLTSFGQVAVLDSNPPQVIDTPPALAGFDERVDTVLDDAVAAGTLVRRERRRVVGRDCQVYRSAGPLVEGLRPVDAQSQSYADVCIDASGIVVEEVWVQDGKTIRRRLATQVVEGPAVDDAVFHLDQAATLPVANGGGAIREVTATAEPPGPFATLKTPEGFTFKGRYAVVPPQGQTLIDPAQRNKLVAGVGDVWTRGSDFLLLDRGSTLGGEEALSDAPGSTAVDAGALGQARLIVDPRGSEVRVRKGDRYVRLIGTLPPDELLALARRVNEVEGDGSLAPGVDR